MTCTSSESLTLDELSQSFVFFSATDGHVIDTLRDVLHSLCAGAERERESSNIINYAAIK